MPLTINEKSFFTATEVAKEIGVVRQTLWRWRQEGKIPAGHRYRDRQILFAVEDLDLIREFAHRIEPISRRDAPQQMKLFDEK